MAKFQDATLAIMKIFGSPTWISENIKTIPSNIIGSNLGNEYLRINVITGGVGVNVESTAGQVIVDIFVPNGEGVQRGTALGDTLDKYLSCKTITQSNGSLQTGKTSLIPIGIDSANKALYRYRYTVSFNYYGVTT